MTDNIKSTFIRKINQFDRWRVPPHDVGAYKRRGKFLASTFHQAEFYGRPNDIPNKVEIKNPIYNFSEEEIFMQLFPSDWKKLKIENKTGYGNRIALDARMFCKAKKLEYDAIVLIGPNGRKSLGNNRKPF